MYKIKHFDLGTVALYSFIMTLVLSLIFMLPFGIFISAIGNLAQDSMPYSEDIFPFANMGILFFFLLALAYSVFATIVYTLIALLYNLLSTKLGGIKIAVEKVSDTSVIDQPVEGLSENG